MKRYNIVVNLSATIGINAKSSKVIEERINWLIAHESILQIGESEFILAGGEVTGVFDKDWNDIEDETDQGAM